MLRPLSGVLTLALAVGACRSSTDEILLGLAAPLSEPRGESMRAGAELAVREINEAGGINGRRLTLVALDDSARTDAAIRAAQRFVEQAGIVAVVGHLNSDATNAAAPIYNEAARPLVHVSPSASSPTLSQAGPYSFRVCPDDLVHGERLAQWALETLEAEWAAVLYQNDDYGRGVRAAFVTSFTATGGYIATEDPYGPQLPTFEPFLSRLQAAGGANVLLVAGSASEAVRVLATLDSLEVVTTVLGADGLTGIESLAGADAEGIYVSSAYLPDRRTPKNDAFVAAYRARNENRLPDHRAAGAYDAVHLIATAVDAVGTDREQIRRYLAGVGTDRPAYEGVTGNIGFNENGDVAERQVWIGVVRSGRLVTASEQ